ncbi:hypothetical protein B0T19DRAFT_268759 [Cercophora scortea]|uniref:Nephrocystin 3-like N-terminal domain-containing protein n=1 Tax=Cercophora scortea TaxID=314031 RepID=A0AAE0I715_9PEZI|nr:hypothetical protein B0T19DRAFT_268759 [Cercophora scortea]
MKANEETIKSVGLSLLYEPDDPGNPVVDIVLVHGIGGHPVRSWKCQGTGQGPSRKPTTPNSTINGSSTRKRLRKNPPISQLRRSNSEPLLVLEKNSTGKSKHPLRKTSSKSSSRFKLAEFLAASDKDHNESVEVFWPLDFLPTSCPNARVFTWGHHTLVVDQKPLRLQNDIFAHARELLHELASSRTARGTAARPIIFVAHSTGGLIVKEVLRLAEAERDGPSREVLLSTSGIVFLACPHRSTDRSTLADAIRNMASVTLNVDANDTVLQELSGANNVDVELGQQAFLRIWNDYNFRVKTFQESVILSYRILEIRVEATTRRLASIIGDAREHAETISAIHSDVSKFSSHDDPGYRSLANCLADLVGREEDRRHVLNTKETDCLAALVRPHITFSETHPATSYPGTCLWLYELPDFHAWHHRSDVNNNKILWIRGEPGCGKTILLRSLRGRLERQWSAAGSAFIWSTAEGHDTNTIFFPGTRRQQHEINPANVYRSLLAQLFLHDPHLRRSLLALQNQSRGESQALDDALVVSFFADEYINKRVDTPSRRTFLFVDISDDAGPAYVEELIFRLSQLARNSDFSICVASAHHPELEEDNAINIGMHLRNTDDILRYVNLNLVAEWEERNQTVMMIGQKAGGVFLWAEIVVNILNAAITEGASQYLIEYTLDEVPSDLHGLYEWMLTTLNDREKAESLVLFQWVILASSPMRLNDLFVAVRLTEPAPFASFKEFGPLMAFRVGLPFSMRELRQLRNSEITSDTPHQFHQWLRARSIGLLELKSDNTQGVANEPWGLQKVQPIHSSVRSFFLSGRGFACLARPSSPDAYKPPSSPSLFTEDYIDISHYSLLRACLTYLNMRDFENLGHHSTAGITTNNPATTTATTTKQDASSPSRKKNIVDQRNLVMSSYPFLQYAVDNLLFHLLSPRHFRYFLPQREVMHTLAANRFRLWRRWTSLLSGGGTADSAGIFARHSDGAAAALLSPVFGAKFRLERVFRKLGRLSSASAVSTGATGMGMSPITPITPVTWSPKTPRSAVEENAANGNGNENVNANAGAYWSPRAPVFRLPKVLPAQFRMPPTISLPVPPVGRGKGRKGSPAKKEVVKAVVPEMEAGLPVLDLDLELGFGVEGEDGLGFGMGLAI